MSLLYWNMCVYGRATYCYEYYLDFVLLTDCNLAMVYVSDFVWNKSSTEILHILSTDFGDEVLNRTKIFDWHSN